MKNKLLLAALASLTLAACSNDDVVSVPQNSTDADAITFRSSVTNSRGTEVDKAALTKFNVTALKGSSYEYYWTTNNTREFTLENGIYKYKGTDDIKWPNNETLRFYASNIDDAAFTLRTNTEPYYYINIKDVKIRDQKDYVVAVNKGTRADFSAGIPLDFQHILSQIEIQAKCASSSNYTVKVKGYRISNAIYKGEFRYLAPLSTGGADSNATYAEAQTKLDRSKSWWGDYYISSWPSEFRGGYAYGEDGSYAIPDGQLSDVDNTAGKNNDHYIELGDDYVVINGADDEGTAMIIPTPYSGWALKADGTPNGGFHIDLLVQVDYKTHDGSVGAPIYPAYVKGSTSERICYRGLPKYYGYISVPVTVSWEPGYKYVYEIDLTEGVGIADVTESTHQVVDPDKYDPTKDDGTGELPDEQKGSSDSDSYPIGEKIIGHPVKFGVKVLGWDGDSNSVNVTAK